MNELHLFAGVGGGVLGGLLLGHTPIGAVEIDEYNCSILKQRQKDGVLPPFPIFSDVRKFNADCIKLPIDIICGGFPCQDISSAGKGSGITGEKSSLVNEMLRIVSEVKPRIVFAENSPNLRKKGLKYVIDRLAEIGYDCAWDTIGASDIGSPHKRKRLWLMAYTNEQRHKGDRGCDWASWREWHNKAFREDGQYTRGSWDVLWDAESKLERVLPNGITAGVDRHYAIGNAQVPQVAAYAFKALYTYLTSGVADTRKDLSTNGSDCECS